MTIKLPRFMIPVLLGPIAALIALAIFRPEHAEAHPLGNFTVNRYSRLELYSDAVRIHYVLDMAEIPAFQEMPEIDANGDGELTDREDQTYLARKQAEIAGKLKLTTNGSDLNLSILTSDISHPEGQGGLRTLRLRLLLEAAISRSSVSLEYRDDNYVDRIGWKEIVVRPATGITTFDSNVPSEDASAELTSYPADLLSSPLDVTSASLSYVPGSAATAPELAGEAITFPDAVGTAPVRAGGGFASLIENKDLTLPVVALSLLIALGFGAIHALEPGHGKTFVAAYFVGVKGTARQALLLGLIVAVTHTIGVFVIGMLTLFGSKFVLPEKLYPWLSLASGLMVFVLGVRLLMLRYRGAGFLKHFRPGENHHSHVHDGHEHSHEWPPESPWRGLIALGLADGLTPSPSALIVLLAAVSLDRIGLGILLIAAFSMGLAAILTVVCLSLVYVRRIVDVLSSRGRGVATHPLFAWATGNASGEGVLTTVVPTFGAVVLTAIGGLLTLRALPGSGLPLL